MLRAVLLLLGFVCAGFGFAAFDLLAVHKYNPSAVTTSSFTHVVSDGNGGFYAAGTAGVDVLVVRFDMFGSITHTRVWDTPYVLPDTVRRLTVTKAGDVFLSVSAGSSRNHIVKFSANLLPQWSLYVDPNSRFTTNADGISCIATKSSETVITASIVNASGSITTSLDIPADRLGGVEPCDSTANPGFFVHGARSNQALIARISNTAGGVYVRTTSLMAHSTNRFEQIVADSSGVATALGIIYDGTQARITFFRVTSTGTITSAFYPVVSNPDCVAVKLYGTVARALIGAGGVSIVHEFNRTSFATIRSYTRPIINDFSVLTGPGTLLAASEVGELARFSLSGGNPGITDTSPIVSTAATSPDFAASVGTTSDLAAYISFYRPGMHRESSFRFAGPIERELITSDLGANGTLAQSMRTEAAEGFEVYSGTIIAYRANGALAFAKGFFPGLEGYAFRIHVLPDGSVLAMGYVSSGTSGALGATLYSSTGAVLYAKTYSLPSGVLTPLDIKHVPGVGNFTVGVVDDVAYLIRFAANGNVAWEREIADELSSVSDMLVTPANDLALIIRKSGSADIVIVDSETGAVLQTANLETGTTWSTANLHLAPDGSIVALISRGTPNATMIKRLNSTTLAQLAVYTDSLSSYDLSVSANGRIGVLQFGDPLGSCVTTFPVGLAGPVRSYHQESVQSMFDLALGPTGIAYAVGREISETNVISTYVVKYLPNGVRSAVRRLSGTPGEIFADGTQVWVTGNTPTRAKGINPYAARYSP